MQNSENIITVTEASFDQDVIQKSYDAPVLVDFWAPWCGPCRMLGPRLEKLANSPHVTYFILAKLNVDENPNMSIKYSVRGIPAVKAFYQGQIVSEFTGDKPEPLLIQFINSLAPPTQDPVLNEAESLLSARQYADAEYAFKKVLLDFPEDDNALIGLAKAQLAQGNGSSALEALVSIKDGKALTEAELLKPLATFIDRFGDSVDGEEQEPIEVQYQHAARLLTRGNFEAAMDGLIDVLRQNKRFRKGSAREVLLGIFALLGDNDDLTIQYRRELASVLY